MIEDEANTIPAWADEDEVPLKKEDIAEGHPDDERVVGENTEEG